MKTRFTLIGIALAAALNCSAVSAQVLGGGGLGGGLGGTLSGGMRDMGVMTRGTMNGSLGADMDTGTLRRTTRETASRATNRVTNTGAAARDRVTSKVSETRDTATTATTDAAATAVHEVRNVQIEGAADVAGSTASNVSRDGSNIAGNAQGSATGATSNGSHMSALTGNAQGSATGPVSSALSNKPQLDGNGQGSGAASGSLLQKSQSIGDVKAPANEAAPQTGQPSTPAEPTKVTQPTRALNISGDANGSASASRDSGLTAQGDGSAQASRN